MFLVFFAPQQLISLFVKKMNYRHKVKVPLQLKHNLHSDLRLPAVHDPVTYYSKKHVHVYRLVFLIEKFHNIYTALRYLEIISLPHAKILDLFKLKVFANNKSNFA